VAGISLGSGSNFFLPVPGALAVPSVSNMSMGEETDIWRRNCVFMDKDAIVDLQLSSKKVWLQLNRK